VPISSRDHRGWQVSNLHRIAYLCHSLALFLKPIHLAAESGCAAIVRLLLDRGVEIDARTALNLTPLIIASRTGSEEVCRLLISRGADINAYEFQTTTIYACKPNFTPIPAVIPLLYHRSLLLPSMLIGMLHPY